MVFFWVGMVFGESQGGRSGWIDRNELSGLTYFDSLI